MKSSAMLIIGVGIVCFTLTFSIQTVSAQENVEILRGHTAQVTSVAFSRDNLTLASASADRTIRLWSVTTETHLKTLTGHTDFVNSVAFRHDNRMLASGSDDRTIRLWILNTDGDWQPWRILRGHTGWVTCVAFSPDGSTLASGSSDGTIRLWSTRTWTTREILRQHTGTVTHLAFNGDSSRLASSGFDKTIQLWHINPDGHQKTVIGHANFVWSVSFSGDGRLLASGSFDNLIRLWEADTGEHIKPLVGHTDYVLDVAFSGDGNLLASCGNDKTVRLWDGVTGDYEDTLTGHTDIVYSVALNQDGSLLASGSFDRTVRLWKLAPFTPDDHSDTRTRATLLSLGVAGALEGTIDSSSDVDYFKIEMTEPQGVLKLYVGWGRDVAIELQDSTGTALPANYDVQYGPIEDLRLQHNVRAGTYYIKVTGTDENSLIPSYTLRAHFTPESDIHGDTRATATPLDIGESLTGEIEPHSDVDYFKVEIRNRGVLTLYTEGNLDTVGRLFDENGEHLITSTNNGDDTNFLIYLDVEPGDYYVEVTEFNKDNIGPYELFANFTSLQATLGVLPIDFDHNTPESARSVAYSPNGDVLAAGDNANNVYLFEVDTGNLLYTVRDDTNPQHGDVYSIAFSNDNKWFAIGGEGGNLRVWRRQGNQTWAQAARTTPEVIRVGRTVWSVAFSRDSTKLACGKSSPNRWKDDTVDVWTLDSLSDLRWDDRADDKDKVTLHGHNANVKSIAFHPADNNVLFSGDDDGELRLWDVDSDVGTVVGNHDSGKIECVAISSEGIYASGDSDGDIVLWKSGFAKKPLERIHTGAVKSLAFHPNGGLLVSGGDDGTLHLWNVQSEQYMRGLQLEQNDKIEGITFNRAGDAIAIAVDQGSGKVYQFALTSITGFANRGNFSLDIPRLISDVAHGENATYFVLNLQFPTLSEGDVNNPIYEDCVITLDLPGVQHAPVPDKNSTDDRLNNPLYFMYSLQTPHQRIEAVEAEGEAIIKSVIGSGVGSIIGTLGGLVLPASVRDLYRELAAFVIGEVSGHLIGIGLKQLEEEDPSKEDMILAETADPFFLIQPKEQQTDRPPLEYSVLFLIEKEISEVGIAVEQAYRLQDAGPLYTVKYIGTWDLKRNNWSANAPSAQPVSLEHYPPFQMLPPEEQAYLLRHFGGAVNRNARHLWIPQETSLLPNYPNPFNPETWIPYQLAKSAAVTVTIYDIQGRVVRDLNLGHQRPGVYHSRSRAAHWDGRNAHGEPVASGVYFYTLKAADFAATKKMLIRK